MQFLTSTQRTYSGILRNEAFLELLKYAAEQLYLLYRLFDKNGDGFVNKREFKWMASKERLNKKQIDLTFQVHFC
jgi:hypothetical protein